MTCPLCDTLARCRAGSHALHVATLDQTTVMLGDNQGCPGWCVAILNDHAEHLDGLAIERQARVFAEVARVARVIRGCYPTSGIDGAPPRINYECLGNQVGHVHWHVIPRHAHDPTPRLPVWGWTQDALRGTMSDESRATLARTLRAAISPTG